MIKTLTLAALLLMPATLSAQLKTLQPNKLTPFDPVALENEIREKFGKLESENTTEEEKEKINSELDETIYPDKNNIDVWRGITGLGEGCSWYCEGGPKQIKSSSYLKAQGANTYLAANIHDLNLKTAWVEGVKGYGIGQSVTYTFAATSPRVTKIMIANGYAKSKKSWKENSRVKLLKVYYNNKPFCILALKDMMGIQEFEFKEPFGAKRITWDDEKGVGHKDIEKGAKDWTLKFEILDVYKGDKYDDTAISEIYFSGLDVHCLVKGTQIKMANGKTKAVELLGKGDEVITLVNGEEKVATIEGLVKTSHTEFVTYDLGNGKTLTCTTDHPILLSNGSWASANPEKSKLYKGMDKVARIKVGDKIAGSESKEIVNISTEKKTQDSYTITALSKGNNFIANGVVVATEEVR